jgi:hypothetical protein
MPPRVPGRAPCLPDVARSVWTNSSCGHRIFIAQAAQ